MNVLVIHVTQMLPAQMCLVISHVPAILASPAMENHAQVSLNLNLNLDIKYIPSNNAAMNLISNYSIFVDLSIKRSYL